MKRNQSHIRIKYKQAAKLFDAEETTVALVNSSEFLWPYAVGDNPKHVGLCGANGHPDTELYKKDFKFYITKTGAILADRRKYAVGSTNSFLIEFIVSTPFKEGKQLYRKMNK